MHQLIAQAGEESLHTDVEERRETSVRPNLDEVIPFDRVACLMRVPQAQRLRRVEIEGRRDAPLGLRKEQRRAASTNFRDNFRTLRLDSDGASSDMVFHTAGVADSTPTSPTTFPRRSPRRGRTDTERGPSGPTGHPSRTAPPPRSAAELPNPAASCGSSRNTGRTATSRSRPVPMPHRDSRAGPIR